MTILAVDGLASRLEGLTRLLNTAFPMETVIAKRDPLAAGQYSFNNPVDILFAAVELPRLDGLKLVEFVRHANPQAFVFLIAASKGDAESGLWEDEVDGLLQSPVTETLLQGALELARHKRGQAGEEALAAARTKKVFTKREVACINQQENRNGGAIMEDNKKILDDVTLDEVSGGVTRQNLPVVRYLVVRGDTLSKLAQRFGTTVDAIMRMNSIIKDKNKIQAGWTLIIPDHWS